MGKVGALWPVLESVGLGFMLLSVVLGLLYLWMSSSKAAWVADGSPWHARIHWLRPMMIVAMLMGAALLISTWVLSRPPRPKAGNQAQAPLPQSTPLPAPLPLPPQPNPAAPALPSVPADPPAPAPKVPDPAPSKAPAPKVPDPPPGKAPPAIVTDPVPGKAPTPKVPDPPPGKVPGATPNPAKIRPGAAPREETPRPLPKTATFNARCSRILEKAGSGEPLSAAEQQEMVSKCQ